MERRTAAPAAPGRPVQRRDYSHIKGDLIRIFVITAFLVGLLIVLTLVLS